MKLSRKILIPFLLLTFSLLAVFSVGFIVLYIQRNDLRAKIAEGELLNSLAQELSVTQRSMELAVLSYRFERRPTSAETIQKYEERSQEIISRIRSESTETAPRDLVERISETRSGQQTINRELLDSIEKKDEQAIERSFVKWSTKAQSIDAAVNDLVTYNLTALQRSADILDTYVRFIFVVLIIIVALSIILSFALFYYFNRIITKPIEKLSYAADRITLKQFDSDTDLDIDSNDEIGRLARVFRDMAVSVKAYYEHLEGEIRKKDEFISIASHELKTPLTSLKIYIQVLHELAKRNNHAQYDQYLEKIDKQSDKLNKLVANLLDIARIEGGKIIYNKESFDINPLVREIVEEAQAASGTHRIIQEGRIDEPVYGDRDRIAQVITNLISNAIKYSPEADRIIIRLSKDDGMARIEVQDFGLGVDKHYHDKLFERFFRINEKNQITFPGMGVGLYISSQIITQHGGTITIESERGKGSTFICTIPLIHS